MLDIQFAHAHICSSLSLVLITTQKPPTTVWMALFNELHFICSFWNWFRADGKQQRQSPRGIEKLRGVTAAGKARAEPCYKWSPHPQDSIKPSRCDTNLQLYYRPDLLPPNHPAPLPISASCHCKPPPCSIRHYQKTQSLKSIWPFCSGYREITFPIWFLVPPPRLVWRINHFTANCNATPPFAVSGVSLALLRRRLRRYCHN